MFENNNFFQKKLKCLVAMVTEQNHSYGYNMSYMSDGLILCVNVYVNAMNDSMRMFPSGPMGIQII